MNSIIRLLPSRDSLRQMLGSGSDAAGVEALVSLLAAAGMLRDAEEHYLRQEKGISQGKFALLASLYCEGPGGVTTVSERIGVRPATVSVMVKRMTSEKEPLVALSPAECDGRGRTVELTGKGKALVEELFPGVLGLLGSFLSPLTGRERTELVGLLKKLVV